MGREAAVGDGSGGKLTSTSQSALLFVLGVSCVTCLYWMDR